MAYNILCGCGFCFIVSATLLLINGLLMLGTLQHELWLELPKNLQKQMLQIYPAYGCVQCSSPSDMENTFVCHGCKSHEPSHYKGIYETSVAYTVMHLERLYSSFIPELDITQRLLKWFVTLCAHEPYTVTKYMMYGPCSILVLLLLLSFMIWWLCCKVKHLNYHNHGEQQQRQQQSYTRERPYTVRPLCIHDAGVPLSTVNTTVNTTQSSPSAYHNDIHSPSVSLYDSYSESSTNTNTNNSSSSRRSNNIIQLSRQLSQAIPKNLYEFTNSIGLSDNTIKKNI
jgi:hypothetical protein